MTDLPPVTEEPAPSRPNRWGDISHWPEGSLLGILMLIAVLPYLNTLANDFLYTYDKELEKQSSHVN